MSSALEAKRASMPIALLLILTWGLLALVGFALQWRGQATTPAPPSTEQLAALQGTSFKAMALLAEIFFLVALIYPAWGVANRAQGKSAKQWLRPILLLAVLVGFGAVQAVLIHLKAPRDSFLWDTQFGAPLRSDLMSTEMVVLLEAGRSALAALTTLAIGLFAIGAAARFSGGAKRPMVGFVAAVLPLAIGHLALQWCVHSRELWRMDLILTGSVCAALLLLSAPLWFRLERPGTEKPA